MSATGEEGSGSSWARLVPGSADLVLVAALLVTLPLGIYAEDLWWLLAAGREMVATGWVPTENLFSFTAPDQPWVHHEWGFALAAWLTLERLGVACLMAARALLFAATLWLLHRQATRGGRVILPLLMTGATFLLLYGQATVRPWLLAYLLFTTELTLLWRRTRVGWRSGAALCGLMLLWANTHGSWMLGLGVLWLEVGAWLVRRPRDVPVVPVAAAVCTALTFMNPYGHRLHLLVADYLRGHPFQELIVEWGPPDPASFTTWVFAAFLAFTAWAVLRARGKLHTPGVILLLLLAAMTLRSARNAGLFAIAATMLLSRDMGAFLPQPGPWIEALARRERAYQVMARRWQGGVAGWLVVVAVLGVFVWRGRSASIDDFTAPEHCPARELLALADRGTPRVAAHFQWGGCAIYQGWPELQVFYDQRNDPYPDEVLADFMTLHTASEGWEDVLDEHGVDAVIWRPDEDLASALDQRPGWIDVTQTPGVAVFVREGPERR